MSEYGDNIRKIAHYEYLLKLIRQAQATADEAKKLAIGANKSIAYLDKSSLSAIQQAAVSGATKPTTPANQLPSGSPVIDRDAGVATDAAKDGASQAIDNQNPLNGVSSLGPVIDAGGTDNTGKDGVYNIDSILDAAVDSAGKYPPVPSGDGGVSNSRYTGDTINALTNLQTDDESRILRVSLADATWGSLGPSDWDNIYTPPPDPTYTPGRIWALISGVTKYFSNTFNGLMSVREEVDGTVARSSVGGSPYINEAVVGSSIIFTNPLSPTGGTVYAFKAYDSLAVGIGQYGQEPCGLSTGSQAVCDVATANPPLTLKWSDLGFTQLGWVSGLFLGISPYTAEYVGRFMPNPFDINVPDSYINGGSILDLKTLDGTPLRIGPLREGGWYMYYRDPMNSNLPAGNVTDASVGVVNSNRTFNKFITPNELAKMLP